MQAAWAGFTNKPVLRKLEANSHTEDGKGVVICLGWFARGGKEYVASGEHTFALPVTVDKLAQAATDAGRKLGNTARKKVVK